MLVFCSLYLFGGVYRICITDCMVLIFLWGVHKVLPGLSNQASLQGNQKGTLGQNINYLGTWTPRETMTSMSVKRKSFSLRLVTSARPL